MTCIANLSVQPRQILPQGDAVADITHSEDKLSLIPGNAVRRATPGGILRLILPAEDATFCGPSNLVPTLPPPRTALHFLRTHFACSRSWKDQKREVYRA